MSPLAAAYRSALGLFIPAALGLLALATTGLLLLAAAPLPARGAHEWRAAWGAPYPLEVAEERAAMLRDSVWAEVSLSVPFEVPGLTFQKVRIRSPGGRWEAHAGALQGEGYREWHLGAGRWMVFGSGTKILVGARLFSINAGPSRTPLRWACTLMARVSPGWLRSLELEAGIVDASLHHQEEVAPVIVTRAVLCAERGRLVVERSVVSAAGAETVIVAEIGRGALGVVQAYRWSVGEASLGLALRTGAIRMRLGQRWHPALGRTPWVAIAWLGGW